MGVILFNNNWWGGDKRAHAFPEGISPKMIVTARLGFELAYNLRHSPVR